MVVLPAILGGVAAGSLAFALLLVHTPAMEARTRFLLAAHAAALGATGFALLAGIAALPQIWNAGAREWLDRLAKDLSIDTGSSPAVAADLVVYGLNTRRFLPELPGGVGVLLHSEAGLLISGAREERVLVPMKAIASISTRTLDPVTLLPSVVLTVDRGWAREIGLATPRLTLAFVEGSSQREKALRAASLVDRVRQSVERAPGASEGAALPHGAGKDTLRSEPEQSQGETR
jgi:hypothetical protein